MKLDLELCALATAQGRIEDGIGHSTACCLKEKTCELRPWHRAQTSHQHRLPRHCRAPVQMDGPPDCKNKPPLKHAEAEPSLHCLTVRRFRKLRQIVCKIEAPAQPAAYSNKKGMTVFLLVQIVHTYIYIYMVPPPKYLGLIFFPVSGTGLR